MPNRPNATYITRGLYQARRIISNYNPDWKVECHNGYYVIIPQTGEVLSPLCAGENSAIKFAALLLSSPMQLVQMQRMVDELTGQEYEE